jgi:hypothetical protein
MLGKQGLHLVVLFHYPGSTLAQITEDAVNSLILNVCGKYWILGFCRLTDVSMGPLGMPMPDFMRINIAIRYGQIFFRKCICLMPRYGCLLPLVNTCFGGRSLWIVTLIVRGFDVD